MAKLFSILALLCMTAASAMAQDPSIPVQQEDLSWEFTMPAVNKLLMVEYFPSTLTLEANDIAMGTVEVVKESGVTDNGDGTYSVEDGTEVTIKAKANNGYYMDQWLDDQGMEITDGTSELTDFLWNSSMPQNGTLTLSMGLDDRYVMADFLQAGYVVTIPAHEFATYYADETLTLPTTETAAQLYTVTSVNDNEVVLSQPINVADSYTPLLVYNKSNEAKDVLLLKSVGTPEYGFNVSDYFHGTLDARTFSASEVQQKAFFVCNGKQFVPVRTAGTIAPNRCWLAVGGESTEVTIEFARALNIVFEDGEATGINATGTETHTNSNDFYDLNGRKVQSLRKGIYINNGRKVVIK